MGIVSDGCHVSADSQRHGVVFHAYGKCQLTLEILTNHMFVLFVISSAYFCPDNVTSA